MGTVDEKACSYVRPTFCIAQASCRNHHGTFSIKFPVRKFLDDLEYSFKRSHKMSKTPQNSNMEQCIIACTNCYQTCLKMAMNHCLQTGGRHVEPSHMQIMLTCAEICQACANTMLIGSPMHLKVCAACADVCNACAEDCERIGEMQECATICRYCAKTCDAMAT